MTAEKELIQALYSICKGYLVPHRCPFDKGSIICLENRDGYRNCSECWDKFIKERYKEFFKEEDVVEKPLAGVVPEYIHRQCRMEELSNAIDSHIQTGCIGKGYIEDLLMWIKELHKHILWYTLRERGKSNGRFKSV